MPTSMPSSASVAPGQIPRVDADQIGEDLVGVDDPAVAVAMHDEIAERVDQAAKALLAFLQLPHAIGQGLDSARLRTVVASTDAGEPALGAPGERQQSQRRNADGEQGDGDQARCAEQLGQAGGDQDRDDRRGGADRRGLARSSAGRKRRRRHMLARRRTHVRRLRVRAVGFRLVDLAGFRLHAQCIGTQRIREDFGAIDRILAVGDFQRNACRCASLSPRLTSSTTTRPRILPSTMSLGGVDDVVEADRSWTGPRASHDRDRSASRRQASSRSAFGAITESMPSSETPRRMKGATLPGRSMPWARPQAATAPP